MIFPLGLNQKLFKVPVATILLVGMNFYWHYKVQPDTLDLVKFSAKIHKEEGLASKAAQGFIDYCNGKSLSIKRCEYFSPLVSFRYHSLDGILPPDEPGGYEEFIYTPEYMLILDRVGQITSELRGVREVKEDYKYVKLIRNFESIAISGTLQDNTSSHLSDSPYVSSLNILQGRLSEFHKKQNWLSHLNFSWDALLESQFRHNDRDHLLANMFGLIVLGVFVEQRVHSLVFLILFLLGGTFSNLGFLMISPTSSSTLMGASGNVSFIMGLFYIFFFRAELKVLIPFSRQLVYLAPTALMLPLLFIFSDIIGLLEFNIFETNVAHIAHIIGLSFGLGTGWLLTRIHPVKPTHYYPSEYKLMTRLKTENNPKKQYEHLIHQLQINRENQDFNLAVINFYIFYFKKRNIPELFLKPTRDFSKSVKFFLLNHGTDSHKIKALELISSCPVNALVIRYFDPLHAHELLQLTRHLIASKSYPLAFSLANLYLQKYPGHEHFERILGITKKLFAELYRNEEFDFIKNYKVLSPELKAYFLNLDTDRFSRLLNESPVNQTELMRKVEVTESYMTYPTARVADRTSAFILDLFFGYTIMEMVALPFSEFLFKISSVQTSTQHTVLVISLQLISIFLYYILPTYLGGQTLGRAILNLKVIPSNPKTKRLSIGSLIVRELIAKPVSLVLSPLTWITGSERKMLHDYMSKTRIVDIS